MSEERIVGLEETVIMLEERLRIIEEWVQMKTLVSLKECKWNAKVVISR